MRRQPESGFLPWGLMAFSLAVAAYKAFTLSYAMTEGPGLVFGLLLPDTAFLGLVCVLGMAHAAVNKGLLRMALKFMLALLVLFYTIHSFVLLALDEPMSLFDLGRYLVEWSVVQGFFGPVTISVVLVYVLSLFLDCSAGRGWRKIFGLLGIALLAIGTYTASRLPAGLQKYSFPPIAAWVEPRTGPLKAANYTRNETQLYRIAAADPAEFIEPAPNIILLIVESLSSINSMKTAGQRDDLRAFDQLAENGLLFRNFFANHAASEGGIISLLSGAPPLHYPTATPLMFDEFARQPAVLSEYQSHGYYAGFLTNADLGFIGLDRYISGLGLDLALGRDEVPELSAAPRYVQNAPSDRWLYAEALRNVDRLSAEDKQPWLLTLATVSTHLPYTHPEGGPDTAEAVWRWSLDRLTEFYEALEMRGFFDRGILLVTGDHRQMRPVTDQEIQRFGDSAKARVPLLVIGDGIPVNQTDDRFFQQSDLLRYLARISQPGQQLSPHPIWVERYNRIYGKVESINRFEVFDQADQGRKAWQVRVVGAQMEWSQPRPVFARTVEARVHAQRSSHQVRRNGDGGSCIAGFRAGQLQASGKLGLSSDYFPGNSFDAGWKPVEDGGQGLIVENLGFPAGNSSSQAGVYRFRGFLHIERPGVYWFRTGRGNRACLGISGALAIDQFRAQDLVQGSLELEAGLHEVDFWFDVAGGSGAPALQWVLPGSQKWHWENVPAERFRQPEPVRPGSG